MSTIMAGTKRRTEFFEVNVTPKTKKPRDSDPPTILNLAPFALIPKVCFSNVPVNTTAISKVHIRNPSDLITEVLLELNDEINEIGLELNASQFSLAPSGSDILEIRWKPNNAIQWRGKIPVKHLNGDKKFSYISVACSSVNPQPKKGTKKKGFAKNVPSNPKRTENTNAQIFTESTHLRPLKAVTPIRRETYEVAKPTFFDHTPSIKTQPFLTISELVVDEELETNFYTSRIVSSSPQSKVTYENIKQLREPLKEYNFNTQQRISVKKEEVSVEKRKLEITFNDSFETSNATYDRDSLDSPVRWNRSDSPVFDISSFYLNKKSPILAKKEYDSVFNSSVCHYISKRSEAAPVIKDDSPTFKSYKCFTGGTISKKEDSPSNKPLSCFTTKVESTTPSKNKSFYLTQPDSPNQVLNKDKNYSFWSQISDDKVSSSMISEGSPNQKYLQNRSRRNILQDSSHSLPPTDLKDRPYESLNNLCTTKPRSVSFNTTFHVISSPPSNKNENEFKFSHIPQQPVSFEISPTRPVFHKSISEINPSRFQRRHKNSNEDIVRPKSASQDHDNTVFSQVNVKKSLYDEPDYLLHPYGVTTISDPFSKNAVHPREWLEKLEMELIKWLNSLLTPPIELGSIVEGVDVQKLWDKSTASDLKIAPSREAASKDYVLSDGSRMTILRKAAASLARSDQIKKVLYNIRGKIDSGFLSVKDDISLYHNQGARVKLVQMCMYYNPLWLRIGLEVIYEQVIPLHENKIHRGLVYFLKNHFLSDQEIIDKHKFTKSNHPQGSAFTREMNNFIMLKFLSLVYFLDQAKSRKLIPYDPCLFCKNSPIKESEGMLNEFIKDFLKCVGQFKKTLKFLGYKLEYRQTCLDEFDYGLSSHLELRDGVRLTRTMEIILKDPSYSSKLWTPAFSRIQKIHNVQVALSALLDNGYHFSKEITPTDIVNGHREKIFSLLWQILHEFLAPRYQLSAKKIQFWWRKNYLKVFINRRIVMRKAIVVLQALVRGFLVRRKIKNLTSKAIMIQRWFRRNRECFNDRREFLKKKSVIITIQSWYRRVLLVRKERKQFLLQRTSALIIQRHYRKYSEMKSCRNSYLKMKMAAVTIQRWFRGILLSKKERKAFLMKRNAAIVIQKRYRAALICKIHRQKFLYMYNAAIKIQRWFRNKLACKPFISHFLKQKQAAKTIQRAFRQYKLNKQIREWLALRNKSALIIQNYFLGYLETKKCKQAFIEKKEAAVVIQRWYRNIILLRERKKLFLIQCLAAEKIQRWYRKSKIVLEERKKFIMMKKAAVKIQRWYMQAKQLKQIKEKQKVTRAATIIQARFRGYITRKKLEPVMAKMPKKCVRQNSSRANGLVLSVVFNNALTLIYSQNNCKTRNLGELSFAYNDLDVCIQYSPVLCLELSNSDLFFERLWSDLSLGLRTGPSLNIFRNGLNVVIRLVKFIETTNSVIESMEKYEGLEVLIGLIMKFTEKNTDIYCKVATILWCLLTSSTDKARKIKNNIDLERISYIYKKIMSKKIPDVKKQYIPSKKIDWGYFNKPLEFLSIKTATEELMKALNTIPTSR